MLYIDKNEIVCGFCLSVAGWDIEDYPLADESLPDCELDGATAYSDTVEQSECACWSCQEMCENQERI